MPNKFLNAFAVFGIIATFIILGGNALAEGIKSEALIGDKIGLKQCAVAEVSLEKFDGAIPVTRTCLTKTQYATVKTNLLNEFKDKSKSYDFDINNRELLYMVLDKEVKTKGFSMTGMTKEKLRTELVKLLE